MPAVSSTLLASVKSLKFATYVKKTDGGLDYMLLHILYNTEYLIQWVCQKLEKEPSEYAVHKFSNWSMHAAIHGENPRYAYSYSAGLSKQVSKFVNKAL